MLDLTKSHDAFEESSTAALTYTSYDAGAGAGAGAGVAGAAARGGWQIKEVVGEIDAAEREELIARIPTAFDLEPRLPDFPAAEDLAQRPARLAYATLPDGSGAYWHTVDAGRDASGRPGNVFAHVVVDRRDPADRMSLPITRWRSPDWLRPYGPAAVTTTSLPGAVLPSADPTMDADGCIGFLVGGMTDRPSVARVLLDAVVDALEGGPSVIMLTRDHEESATWISVVSHLLPAPVAHVLSWTTHDRPDLAAADVARGTELIAMPRTEEQGGLGVRPAIVIDVEEEPDLGELGSVHRVRHGEVPVSMLSVLAEGVLADEEVAADVLARRDAIAAQFPSSTSPAWSLAVAVREHSELDEYHDEAERVIADEAPEDVAGTEYADLVARARDKHPVTIDTLLRRLIGAHRRGRPTSSVAARFLQAVLDDPAWLDDPAGCDDASSGAPIPDVGTIPRVAEVDLAPFSTQVRDVLSVSVRRPAGMVSTLRLLDLLDRLAVPGASLDEIHTAADGVIVTADVIAILGSPELPHGWSEQVPAPALRDRFLRRRLAQAPHSVLATIDRRWWRWLYADGSTGRGIGLPASSGAANDRRLYPLAVLATVPTTPPADPAERRHRAEVVTAAAELVITDDATDDDRARGLVAELAGRAPIAPADILRWTRERPHRVSPNLLRGPVLSAPYDQRLMQQVVDAADGTMPAEPGIDAAARLRIWHAAPHGVGAPGWVIDASKRCLEHETSWIGHFADDLAVISAAGVVMAQAEGAEWADPHSRIAVALGDRVRPLGSAVKALLTAFAEQGLVSWGWLAARSFVPRVTGAPMPPGLVDLLDPSFADALIASAMERGIYAGPDTEQALRDAAWPHVRGLEAADAETFFRDYRRVAADWLRERRVTDSEQRRLFRNREENR